MWAIEEKAKIFLILVWLTPPKLPKINELIKVVVIINGLLRFKFKIIKGANFCHVSKVVSLIHGRFSITDGTQKWKGAAPTLVSNAKLIISLVIEKKLFWIVLRMIIEELIAWIRKYLIAASAEKMFFLLIIKGINPRIFISIPIQIGNHEFALTLIIVPKTIIKIKGKEEGLNSTKKGG